MRCEWDPGKDVANRRKHGISFDLAKLVFDDPLAISIPDGFHSDDEDRWVTIGEVERHFLVVVVHTFRDKEGVEINRLISARKATPKERKQYTNLPGGKG